MLDTDEKRIAAEILNELAYLFSGKSFEETRDNPKLTP